MPTDSATLNKNIKPLNYKLQINKFKQTNPKSSFPKLTLSPSKFITLIEDRINYPWRIDQDRTFLCGPNAFMSCVAQKYPDHYAQYMIDLWTFGEAYLGKLKVKPSSDCINASVNLPSSRKQRINPVDWIALASLRDSSNWLFTYSHYSDAASAVTFPETLANWFRHTLFNGAINKTNLTHHKQIDNLLEAQRAYKANKSVCLFISTKMEKLSFKVNATPNHWVVLNSSIKVNGKAIHTYSKEELLNSLDKKIEIYVMTWGRHNGKYPLHTENKPNRSISVNEFLNYYYGFVAA